MAECRTRVLIVAIIYHRIRYRYIYVRVFGASFKDRHFKCASVVLTRASPANVPKGQNDTRMILIVSKCGAFLLHSLKERVKKLPPKHIFSWCFLNCKKT